MADNRMGYRLGRIVCTLHQIDHLAKFIEIDVKPQMLENSVVISVLFRTGKLPASVKISSDFSGNFERYHFDYSKSSAPVMSSAMNQPFKSYFYNITVRMGVDDYRVGWRQRFAQMAREDAQRKANHLEWRNSPHPFLGGRTPDQIVDRGFGPLEIPNVGFVWVGIDRINGSRGTISVQTYPYSGDKNFDGSLRWFMQRGTSLNQALRLNSQHMGELNKQALIGSIQILLGALNTMPGRKIPISQFDRALKMADQINKLGGAIKKIIDRSDVGAALTTSKLSIEHKVQMLNKVEPIAIPSL